MRRLVLTLTLFLLVLAPAAPARAQAGLTPPMLQGKVLDSMRAPVAGARVEAVRDGSTSGPSTVTDERGEFTLAIEPGRYTVNVAAPGFQDASKHLTVSRTDAPSPEFVLEVAGFRDSVTVTAPHGYVAPVISSATRMATPLRDVPQSVSVVTQELIKDQLMTSVADVDIATFFGDPNLSDVRARVNLASANVEHRAGGVVIRNHTLLGDYDRFYQNFVPGAVNAAKTQVALSAYNNATHRRNVFNQTDVIYSVSTGRVRHTLLAGGEVGRQVTDNFRNTGFFNNTTTSVLVPYANPTTTAPVTFRQNATDADNHLRTRVAAAYAQDQIELSRHVQVIGGLRFDRFDLQYHNNRNGDTLTRPDNLVSPRAGLVVRPIAPLSLYGSYSVSYLPSSGDQFSALSVITQQVKPEQFSNYEVGAKWDVYPDLSLTTAVYRLDRTNTRSTDPNDPSRIVQTGSQRTNGYELGVNGRLTSTWRVAGGYAYQDAFVTSATTAAAAGAQVGQVPHHTFSVWNNYQFHPRAAAALGLIRRDDMFAAIDNTVTLPGYTRADAAAFFTVNGRLRLQANVENLFDARYDVNADNNTNISPGWPRVIRIGLTTTF